MTEKRLKILKWIASSKADLRGFPAGVRKAVGHALHIAQEGGKHKDAKPLKGFRGTAVLEIVAKGRDETYRVIYTVQFTEVVYVLHVFKKKSNKGIKTPQRMTALAEQRLKQAEQDYKE